MRKPERQHTEQTLYYFILLMVSIAIETIELHHVYAILQSALVAHLVRRSVYGCGTSHCLVRVSLWAEQCQALVGSTVIVGRVSLPCRSSVVLPRRVCFTFLSGSSPHLLALTGA